MSPSRLITSAEQPYALAMPWMRVVSVAKKVSKVSASSRMVPPSSITSGMTLKACPPCT